MRIVFASIGAHGHLYPLVPLALAARELGHQAVMATAEQFHPGLKQAGLETVTASLGNITWWLAEHPAERRRLVDDPSLISKAVEEFLRYESIVAPGRVVVEETELGGQHLVPGDRLMLLTGSAGRDEAVFDQPDEVIFERSRPHRSCMPAIHCA